VWRLSVNLKQLSLSFVTVRKWLRWKLGGPFPFNPAQSAIAGDYVAQGRQYFAPGAARGRATPAGVAPTASSTSSALLRFAGPTASTASSFRRSRLTP